MAHDLPHIHKVHDGRGVRDVFVDGVQVAKAIFADTKKGIVDCYIDPPKLDKHKKRLLTKRIHGQVTVKFRNRKTDGS